MTKRYAILQKKLQALESELAEIFALPPETPSHHDRSESVIQQFAFLNTLLSVEVASSPSKPHHLSHIARRLTQLQSAFDDWDQFRASEFDRFETGSTCSCTESCLNDDGELGLGSPVLDEPVVLEEPVPEPVEREEIREDGERRPIRGWKHNPVLVFGVMIGAVLMSFLVKPSGFFRYEEFEGSLVPT